MDFNAAGLREISSTFITAFGASLAVPIYRDNVSDISHGDIAGLGWGLHFEVKSVTSNGSTIVLGNPKPDYYADVIIDLVTSIQTASLGYKGETITNEDKVWAGNVFNAVDNANAVIFYFDVTFPPIMSGVVVGDRYITKSLRVSSMEQPRVMANQKQLRRYHLRWDFEQI